MKGVGKWHPAGARGQCILPPPSSLLPGGCLGRAGGAEMDVGVCMAPPLICLFEHHAGWTSFSSGSSKEAKGLLKPTELAQRAKP